MSDAVFSSAYAAELVQRAKDGATSWSEWDDLMGWIPKRCTLDSDGHYDERGHWVAWYRETQAAFYMADNTHVEIGVGDNDFSAAAIDLWLLLDDFCESVNALGSLCQLPDRWSDECREIARGM